MCVKSSMAMCECVNGGNELSVLTGLPLCPSTSDDSESDELTTVGSLLGNRRLACTDHDSEGCLQCQFSRSPGVQTSYILVTWVLGEDQSRTYTAHAMSGCRGGTAGRGYTVVAVGNRW